jgi:hypothetical protein
MKPFVFVLVALFCTAFATPDGLPQQQSAHAFDLKSKAKGGINRMKSFGKNTINKGKDRINRGVSNTKKNFNNFKNNNRNKIDNIKRSTRNTTRDIREKSRNKIDTYRESVGRSTRELIDRSRDKPRSTMAAIGQKLRNYSPKKLFTPSRKQAFEKLGAKGKATVRNVAQRFGRPSADAVTEYLSRSKTFGQRIVSSSNGLIAQVSARTRDPETRRKLLVGALVAAGTAYAVYQHKDDIQYIVLRETMDTVKVPVNGEMKSVQEIYSGAILKRAPFLADSAIANDPAALMAYGITATARDDLMHHVAVVPDGRGGLRTVGDTIGQARGGDEALAVLQIGSSVEQVAWQSARDGYMGPSARLLAGAYLDADGRIGELAQR